MASGRQIELSAAHWLVRLDRSETSTLLAEFELWCRADPRNLTAYLRLLAVWHRLDVLRSACSVGHGLRS